jgi:hypothetical protein
MAKVKVSFNNNIDNENHNFSTKSEAIAVAKSLTTNEVGRFEWGDDNKPGDADPYYYLGFTEYVEEEIEDDGSPLYSQISSNLDGQIPGGEPSSVRRVK